MLRNALEDEIETIERYVLRRKQAEALGHYGLAVEFDDLIRDESTHRDEIQHDPQAVGHRLDLPKLPGLLLPAGEPGSASLDVQSTARISRERRLCMASRRLEDLTPEVQAMARRAHPALRRRRHRAAHLLHPAGHPRAGPPLPPEPHQGAGPGQDGPVQGQGLPGPGEDPQGGRPPEERVPRSPAPAPASRSTSTPGPTTACRSSTASRSGAPRERAGSSGQGGQLGKKIGLEWAGDWTSFREFPHFQLTGGLTLRTS